MCHYQDGENHPIVQTLKKFFSLIFPDVADSHSCSSV